MKAIIDGGKGNDTIYNGVNAVSINGSTGNDYIDNQFGFRLFGRSYRYASDYVPPSKQISKPDNSTLIGGDGNDSISNNGANVTITGGAGADSIVNGSCYEVYPASKVKIDGGTGNDSIFNGADSYRDKNHSYGDDSLTIDGGDGDDYSQTRDGGEYSSISGGKGNDSIFNGTYTRGHAAKYLTISGGAGNDFIYNESGSSVDSRRHGRRLCHQ